MFIYDQVPDTYVYQYTADFLSLFNYWASCCLCTAICTIPYYAVVLYYQIFLPTVADLVYQGRFSLLITKTEEMSIVEKMHAIHSTNHTQKHSSN